MATNDIKNPIEGKDNKCSIQLIMYISYITIIALVIGLISYYNNRIIELTHHYEATLDTVLQTPPTLMIKIPDSAIADNHAQKVFIDDLLKYMDIKYSAKVEQVVNSSDSRLSREMNYMNLWVTIWVGLIGLAGIILPLILGFFERRKWTEEEDKLKEDIQKRIRTFDKELPQNIKTEIWKDNELIEIKESIGDIHGILPIMTLLSYVKELCNHSPGTFSVPEQMETIHRALKSMSTGLRQMCNYLSNHPGECSISHYYFLTLALELNFQQIITIFTKRSLLNRWQAIQKRIEQLKEILAPEKLDQETINTTILLNNFQDLYLHINTLADNIQEIKKNL